MFYDSEHNKRNYWPQLTVNVESAPSGNESNYTNTVDVCLWRYKNTEKFIQIQDNNPLFR